VNIYTRTARKYITVQITVRETGMAELVRDDRLGWGLWTVTVPFDLKLSQRWW